MAVQITPLDRHDEGDVHAFHAISAAAQAADVPDFPALSLDEVRGWLEYPDVAEKHHRFVARVDGEPVGALCIGLPQADNTHLANVELIVHPRWRRRGVGRVQYQAATEFTRAAGRKVMIGSYVVALAGGVIRDPAHAAFAAAMGVHPALQEIRRRLDLPTVDKNAWEALLAEARAHTSGYTVVSWGGHAPDELVAEVARLEGRMVTDAPSGDLIIEPERYDAERMRAVEDVLEQRRRRQYQVGARHDATGALAAWTALTVHDDVDYHAWQGTTIVDPDHRGHRLGMLVKIENLNLAIAHEPALRYVDTWNAAENAHMIAINEVLGFRTVDGWINWQQEI